MRSIYIIRFDSAKIRCNLAVSYLYLSIDIITESYIAIRKSALTFLILFVCV